MIATWYFLVSFMLVTYIVLDGRNFGAGILLPLVARAPLERRQVIAAIGPLWSWHEVWLVGFGGTIFAVFPDLLASAFAGYYLALFLILWCLICRGVSLEVGGHIDDSMWQAFWYFVFVAANFLLALLFGAAGGNLLRGVPLDAQGNFSMAFFSDFSVRGHVGLLDWYTVSIAVFSMVVLAAHGANYLVLKTEGPVRDRSAALARHLWIFSFPLFFLISAATFSVRPLFAETLLQRPLCWLGMLVTGIAATVMAQGIRQGRERMAFLGGNFVIAGLMGTGASTFYPVMLYSTLAEENSMTAHAAAAGPGSLLMALIWWPIAFALAVTYFIYISRRYSGKVSVSQDNQGFY